MFRDPPHYLKPLKTTSTPKRLLWLHCRGYTKRRRGQSELHFQYAALGKTWHTSRGNERRDSVHGFTTPNDLWSDIGKWCPKGRRVVLFTYDLAEQMRLSHMLACLPDDGWALDKIVLERTASWCLFRKDTRSLMCCDLASWAPVPWEKIVSTVMETEGAQPEVAAGPGYPAQVAELRVRVIRAAVLQILHWIEGENLGQFRPTGSGQSFTGYRRRFLQARLLVHDQAGRLDAERRAMHTGRAEAWLHGRLRSGRYVEYDLHAAYATIGRDCEVPTAARGEIRKPSPTRLRTAMQRYAVLAHVTVSTDVECVPYATNGRTVWPVGTFDTLLWDPELTLAMSLANKITVNHAWLYTRAPALHDFCKYVLESMDGQTQVYGTMPQRVLKHWSRCLVGRFGLRYRDWIKFGPLDPPDVRLVTYLDLDEGTQTDMLYAGTQRLLLGELTEARESLPQIPGWIMSECRRRLWHMMADVGRDLVYVDTDSVILRSQGDDPHELTGPDHGSSERWIRKGTYDRLTIHGPRNLEIGYSRRVSGLPLSAEQVRPLEFTAEIMRGIKHAMRAGELDRVVSMPRTFHLGAPDLRRIHNPDGTTSPFRIG